MIDLQNFLFDVFALSLPRGHGFGDWPPIEGWQSSDGTSIGVVTKCVDSGDFGLLAMRRRVDQVWTVVAEEKPFERIGGARERLEPLLRHGLPLEEIAPGVARRPQLGDVKGRTPSEIFGLLARASHQAAGWLLNQVYLALPNPDKNWVSDCQTANFHTRLWEAQLLASFREQGLLVTQPEESPDYRIENRLGGEAWVEAVTANSPDAYDHVNAPLSSPPEDRLERFLGPAAVRFAKTLGTKLGREYHRLPHVVDKPFILAIADFHASGSMTWSRESLISYLYGIYPQVVESDGRQLASLKTVSHLLGDSGFPAGLFCNTEHEELSAVIFTNACSIAKFNRVAISAGFPTPGLRYTRIGTFFDRSPRALKGIPFSLEITSKEYRSLWPQGYEPWCAELEVFHNPFARNPISRDLLPEATHWFLDEDGDVTCESFYETSILSSTTQIQSVDQSEASLDDRDRADALD